MPDPVTVDNSTPIGTMLSHAYNYARAGAEVFPVNHLDKSPLVSQYQATTDLETIERWWQAHPEALIGYRVAASQVILDVDPRHGGLETWQALKSEMPDFETRKHYSGRRDNGGHIWFLRPDDKLSITKIDTWARERGLGHAVSRSRWSCGIDLLQHDHRYSILPPSLHPETRLPYEWAPGGLSVPIAPMPALLCDLLTASDPMPAPALPLKAPDPSSIADWYSANHSWGALLGRHGWRLVAGDGDTDGSRWRHPNATAAYSATIRHGCLFVYSPNTPFEPTSHGDVHGYTRFHAFAVLEHGGDQSKAAGAAREEKDGPKLVLPTTSLRLPAAPTNGNGKHAEHQSGASVVSASAQLSKLDAKELRIADAQQRISGRLRSTAEILTMPPPTWLIDGILVSDTLSVLWGAPGSAKSFTALDWALSVASGAWWFGRKVMSGSVLYIAAEGVAGLSMRVRAWSADRNVRGLDAVTWLPETVNLLDAAQGEALERVIDQMQPIFIVVDTLARSMAGADENAVQDMGRTIERLDAIRTKTHATVLLIHHSTKEQSTMRGSSALKGAVDTSIECKKDDSIVILKCDKQKDAEPFNPIRLHLVTTEPSCVLQLSHSTTETAFETVRRSALMRRLRETVIETFGETGATGTDLRNVLEEREKVSKATALRYINDLVTEGFLRNAGAKQTKFYVPGPRWANPPPDEPSHCLTTVSQPSQGPGSSSSHGPSLSGRSPERGLRRADPVDE